MKASELLLLNSNGPVERLIAITKLLLVGNFEKYFEKKNDLFRQIALERVTGHFNSEGCCSLDKLLFMFAKTSNQGKYSNPRPSNSTTN